MRDTRSTPISDDFDLPAGAIEAISQALQGLRYGQVTVTVQDGRVMQVDRTDRVRLQSDAATNGSGMAQATRK